MRRSWPVLAIFILSGGAGLVYEVVWARQLVLVFGNTTQAISAILTGFFGGMAIGSGLGGRLGDRVSRPLRVYGLLELILVVVVLLTPITFSLLHEAYRGAFGVLESHAIFLGLVRFGLSLLALGPATILMGVTLPVLTRYLTNDPGELSLAFGRLYAANTAGAILGTIGAGFFLIELFGLSGSLTIGAACSFVAGIIALAIDRAAVPPAPVPDPKGQNEPPLTGSLANSRLRLPLVVAFVSGLTSLGYQVLWTRLLSSGTGGSTYVFTTILAVFLIGLAGGAVAFNMVRSRISDVVGFIAQGQLAVALLTLGPLLAWTHLSHGSWLNLAFRFENLVKLFLGPVVAAVLPATFIMGLTFPAIAMLIGGSRDRISTHTGFLLSANTLGSIAGTFLTPFFLIPLVGSSVAVALFGLTNLAVGLLLAYRGGMRDKRDRRFVVAFGAGVVLLISASLATGRVFVDQNEVRITRAGGTVFASREDRIASVQAGALDAKQLWVGGTSMTLLTVDAKLMPLLPLMLRPSSQRILTVAFGMGSSHRTALKAGLGGDVVELVPSVPLMFGWFYDDANEVLANPRGRVIISDGRNYMELSRRTYDIIVTDPPPPIESAGVSVISSFEYYQAVRKRLTQGGVVMQWIPFGQTVDEFRDHLRTFQSVFPNVIVAVGPGNNGFFFLGSLTSIAFDSGNIRTILSRPGLVDDLSAVFDSPENTVEGWVRRIPTLVWLVGEEVARFSGTGALITDDRPLPEYFLLRHLTGDRSARLTPSLAREFVARSTGTKN